MNTPRVWYTSDTHFGHDAIRRHCARPFATVEEMDETLVANWNAVVARGDRVYHLGDFAFRSAVEPERILRRLNGEKHLVSGNHDGKATLGASGWASVNQLTEVKDGGHRIILCHYALQTWNASHYGALHLFGHSHGKLRGDAQSCDVGVDAWRFFPVLLDQIRERLAIQPPRGCRAANPDEAA